MTKSVSTARFRMRIWVTCLRQEIVVHVGAEALQIERRRDLECADGAPAGQHGEGDEQDMIDPAGRGGREAGGRQRRRQREDDEGEPARPFGRGDEGPEEGPRLVAREEAVERAQADTMQQQRQRDREQQHRRTPHRRRQPIQTDGEPVIDHLTESAFIHGDENSRTPIRLLRCKI